MIHRRFPRLVIVLVAGAAARTWAQDSPFGIHGLGVPGRFESVRARATGGAFAAFDAFSALTDVSIVDVGRLTATAAGATSYLSDELSGVRGTRRTARFPLMQVMGPVWRGVLLGGGAATYLDRSYRVVISDTVTLDGAPRAVTDELSSDGGVSDFRLVAARRFRRIAVGAGLHLLTGSTRVLARRTFADTTLYGGVVQADEIAYRGMGYSASAMLTLTRSLQVTGFWRSDTRLRSEVGASTVATNDLPQTVGGAVRWQPVPAVNLAASAIHTSWATAADSEAYTTTNWSAGGEVLVGHLPVRVGVRGGHLPFGPGGRAPRELAVAAGSGLALAGGRGLIDLTLERLRRTGQGLIETAWTVLVGVTVRP